MANSLMGLISILTLTLTFKETNMNENMNEERYNQILQTNTSAMNLLASIEKTQKRRRLKAWVRKWWYKFTFQSYKNERQKITKGKIS